MNEGEVKERNFRALLVSLRRAEDPMARHELDCFRRATELEELEMVCALDGELTEEAISADLLFFGGSGEFSVLDGHQWVRRFLDALLRVIEQKIPAWASCFAFQGLALAMGGEVERDDARQQLGARPIKLTEAGRSDPLFGHLDHSLSAQFGHHDHVVRLPEGVLSLAEGNGGYCQAFHVVDSEFWGAQFHPELNKQATLHRWNHYRDRYEAGRGDSIDRELRLAEDTPQVTTILPKLVQRARGLAGRR